RLPPDGFRPREKRRASRSRRSKKGCWSERSRSAWRLLDDEFGEVDLLDEFAVQRVVELRDQFVADGIAGAGCFEAVEGLRGENADGGVAQLVFVLLHQHLEVRVGTREGEARAQIAGALGSGEIDDHVAEFMAVRVVARAFL